jgi:drug/metabolite transporter (DMT)-like permease
MQVRAKQELRRPLDVRAAGLMTLFCVVLGLQQVAIKSVIVAVSPLAQIGIRSFFAAVIIVAVARWRRVDLWVPNEFGPGLAVGFGFALEFALVALGLNYTYASHMSVFLYTAPVFAAVGLHLFVPGEQLAPRHWLGVIIAFIGLVVALAPKADISSQVLLGDGIGVAAGASWAATTVTVRTSVLSEAPPLRTVAYQLIATAVLLVPAAGVLGDLETIHMTRLAWASLSFQTLFVAAGAVLLWFWLLRRYLASRLGVFSLLSPVFGVVFGVLLLGDPISINFAIGGLAILTGILLVNSRSEGRKQ